MNTIEEAPCGLAVIGFMAKINGREFIAYDTAREGAYVKLVAGGYIGNNFNVDDLVVTTGIDDNGQIEIKPEFRGRYVTDERRAPGA